MTFRASAVRLSFVGIFSSLSIAACGGSEANTNGDPGSPYTSDGGKTVVIGDGKNGVYSTPAGGGCVQVGNECVKPQDKCGADARADVIVDSTGKVIEIVCYPAASAPPTIDSNGDVDLSKQNKGVVAIDGADDGIDVAGNVTSSGNNVVVYGQGPAVSVIGGDVTAGGNNFSLRGVTVKKNVTVTGNNATMVLCVVEGDVTIEGNNAVIAECAIYGRLTIKGQNAILVSNRVAGGITIDGGNATCDANVLFSDANANHVIDSGELGAAISCSDKKK